MPVLSPHSADREAYVPMLREEEPVHGESSRPQGAHEELSRPQGAEGESWRPQGAQDEGSASQLDTTDPMVQMVAMQQAMLKELQLQ